MSKQRGLGSLADLAKILEEASNPESTLREDRKENKPKPTIARKGGAVKKVRVLDPKRKLWYEKRLKEQSEDASKVAETVEVAAPEVFHTPALTKAAATRVGGGLLESLATAKTAKPKAEGGRGRAEAWRRKPGDPIF